MDQIIGIKVLRQEMNILMDLVEITQILKDLRRLSKNYRTQFPN